MTARACAAVVMLAAALGGCAALAPPSTPSGSSAIAGQLALQVDARAGHDAQSLNASFELRGNADDGRLELSTALGTTLAVAHWGGDQARLVTPQGEQRFDSLEALSQGTFGEALPLRALPDWLRGRPWPGAAEPARVLAGGAGFEQLGWIIDLAQFDSGRLQALRAAHPVARLRVQLDPR